MSPTDTPDPTTIPPLDETKREWARKMLEELGLELEEGPATALSAFGVGIGAVDPRGAPTRLAAATGMISVADWDHVKGELESDAPSTPVELDAVLVSAGTKTKVIEKIQECQPVIDAPRNNPERKKIEARLGELEAIEKALAQDLARISGTTPEDDRKRDEIRQASAKKKMNTVNAMERELDEWINRRTSQHLPLPIEALAMADIVQNTHREVITEFITNGWSPPPVADEDNLTDDEKQTIKRLWDGMLDGSGPVKLLSSAPADTTFAGEMMDALDQANLLDKPVDTKLAQLRIDVLAGMARLLGAPSGRDLVLGLEDAQADKGHSITFLPSTEPVAGADPAKKTPTDASSFEAALASPGVGASSVIGLPVGCKDSDNVVLTETGSPLFCPVPVAIGHELVHALHAAKGQSMGPVSLGTLSGNWNNMEEYWTIHKGDLSEQTIRQDYGMSAERIFHIGPDMADVDQYETFTSAMDPAQARANAALAAVRDGKELRELIDGASGDAVDVDAVLANDRKFGTGCVEKMDDSKKLAIYKDDSCKGPLPDGWDPVRLTVATIKSIVADKLPCRMPMLGWTAYDLPYTGGTADDLMGFPFSLKDIVTKRMHHPRSKQGRSFRSLGGRKVMDTDFAPFKTATGTALGDWSDSDWRTNLRRVEAASGTADRMISSVPFVTDGALTAAKPSPSDPLKARLKKISDRFAEALAGHDPDTCGPLFADDALTHFKINKPTAAEQLAELKKKETALKSSDTRLKDEGGLTDVASLSLVVRDRAAGDLKRFEKDGLVKEAKALAKQLDGLIGKEGKAKEAADLYATLLGKVDLLTAKLSAVAPRSVADAIRAIVITPLDADILSRSDLGDLLSDAFEAAESQAKTLLNQAPGMEEILSNTHLCDALGEYVGLSVRGGRTLWSFRGALHLRETRQIADLAQGPDLISAGLKQNTVVLLRRDATDIDGRASATTEVRSILDGLSDTFVDWYKQREGLV